MLSQRARPPACPQLPLTPAAAPAPPPQPEAALSDSEECYFCGQRIYVLERISAEGKFFHRSCFTCHRCSVTLRLGGYTFDHASGEHQELSTWLQIQGIHFRCFYLSLVIFSFPCLFFWFLFERLEVLSIKNIQISFCWILYQYFNVASKMFSLCLSDRPLMNLLLGVFKMFEATCIYYLSV